MTRFIISMPVLGEEPAMVAAARTALPASLLVSAYTPTLPASSKGTSTQYREHRRTPKDLQIVRCAAEMGPAKRWLVW